MQQSIRTWLNISEWTILGLAVAAFTITEQYHWYTTAGLLLLPLSFVMRCVRNRKLLPRTGMELPLLLFIGSAGIATWLAVERETAILQLARILAAAVLFYAVVQTEKPLKPWLVAGGLMVTLGLAFYWSVQHDFSAYPGKFAWITHLGVWINQHTPTISGPTIHPNVAATSITPGLAFAAGMAAWGGKRKPWLRVLSVLAMVILLGVLLLTSSRGAWLGTVATALLVGLIMLQRARFRSKLSRRLFWGVMTLSGVLVVIFLTLTGTWEPLLGQVPDPSGTLQSRLDLWRQSLLLIGDAPFTGYGLMSFRMVYATYGILIHVPLHDHAHNTFLEVCLEQGLIGLFALLWGLVILLRGMWRAVDQGKTSLWGWVGMAAISILIIHSLLDVVYYVMRPLPMIGICLGLAVQLNPDNALDSTLMNSTRHWLSRRLVVISIVVGAASLFAFTRPLMAVGYANLGVIEQTRRELSKYDSAHFDNPTLDEVRQQLDLSRAVGWFEQSLHWQTTNRTASQRLAQIYLSLGEYPRAQGLIEALWNSGYRDEVTRLLLGDILVAQGNPESGAEVVRDLPQATGRLNTQAWYRYFRQADYARAAFAWQAVLILDPDNALAQHGLQTILQP